MEVVGSTNHFQYKHRLMVLEKESYLQCQPSQANLCGPQTAEWVSSLMFRML